MEGRLGAGRHPNAGSQREFPRVYPDEGPFSRTEFDRFTSSDAAAPAAHFRDAAGTYWCLRPNGQLAQEPGRWPQDAADPLSEDLRHAIDTITRVH